MNALVLVVDDEKQVRGVLGEYLRGKGCHIIEAADGGQAVLLAEQSRPAAIIMDVMMPGIYGTSAVKRLRDIAATSRTPVVVYSGCKEEDVRKLLPESPLIRFVKKGTPLADLWRILRAMLDGE